MIGFLLGALYIVIASAGVKAAEDAGMGDDSIPVGVFWPISVLVIFGRMIGGRFPRGGGDDVQEG